MKISKKSKTIAAVVLVLLVIVFIVIQIINAQPQRIYEQAKKTCPKELWIIEQDAVWTDVKGPIKPPYPTNVHSVTGEQLLDFACNKQSAEAKI